MTTKTKRPATKTKRPANDAALAAFVARKAEIDTMLARLASLSSNHFDAAPEDVHWGHVGDLGRYAELLKRITDIAFSEGECAE